MEKRSIRAMLLKEASELRLEKGSLLFGATSVYVVTKHIGEGHFGKVVQCRKTDTFENVAIKILKPNVKDTEQELAMLNTIGVLDPDQNNLVRFRESFKARGHTCLVFDLLDMTLLDLLEQQEFSPLALDDIRDVAEQLLVALAGLKELGVLHTDIKPDNVMVVRAGDRPMKVKLVDFGLAVLASKVHPGLEMQPTGYRAPEVSLGLPFTEAVDVWSVGCILGFLYLGYNLFPVHCDYQMMKIIVQILGQPSDHQLAKGHFTRFFFTKEEVDGQPRWRFMTPEEYTAVNSAPAQKEWTYFKIPGSLDELVQIHPVQDQTELEDRAALVGLLKGLLHLDGEQRLTPRAALQHPFITRSYRDQGPLPGPSQDAVSRPTLDPLSRPPEDPLSSLHTLGGRDHLSGLDPTGRLDPLDGPPLHPLSGPPEDPLCCADPLCGLAIFSGLDPLGGPPSDPLGSLNPLCGLAQFSGLEPLSGPPSGPLSGQDPLSGLDALCGLALISGLDPSGGPSSDLLSGLDPLSGPSSDPLSGLDPLSGPSSDNLSGLDPLSGPSRVPDIGPFQFPISAGPFQKLKKRIHGTLKRIRNNLLSCLKPQTED